jgi:WD40 repeat protein
MDGTLRLWDVETGEELSRFADYPALLSVAYAPDGKHAVTGGDDCSVRVWRLPD